jgi:hypothetical protein
MSHRARALGLLVLACFVAEIGALASAPAQAAPYHLTASLRLDFGALQGPVFTASGNGEGGPAGVQLPSGLFSGTQTAQGGTTAFSSLAVSLASNGPGAFSGTPLHGTMPVLGAVRLLGFGTTLYTIALQSSYEIGVFGVGGMNGSVAPTSLAPVVTFAPFDVGPVPTSGPMTSMAAARGPAATMFTGSDSRTPAGLGRITLVSPAKVRFGGGGAPVQFLVGELAVEFVPEPGAPLLLVVGGALLVVCGRQRAGRRSFGARELPRG